MHPAGRPERKKSGRPDTQNAATRAGGTRSRPSAAASSPADPAISAAERRTALPFLLALGLFLLLRGVLAYLPAGEQRLWGIDFPAWLGHGFFPTLLLWAPFLFLLPSVAGALIPRGPARRTPSGLAATVRALLLTAAAGALAWQVQTAYAFLGDGTWYAAELYRSISLEGYANSMIKPSAWLTGLVLDGIARVLRPDDIRLPFTLAGIAGMLAAAAGVFFSTRHERGQTVLAAVTMLLFGCGTLVFFGYIELYAFTYGLSIAYVATAWRGFRHALPVWVPTVLLLAAIAFGATAVVWLPSLLLLLHWRARGEEGSFPLRRAAIVLMLLPLAAVAVLYAGIGGSGDNAYLVAIVPYERIVDGLHTGWQRYVLTEPARWVDILNMLLLGLGPLLFVLPVLVVQARRLGLLRAPAVLFGAVSASGGLTLLVFGNTFLGLARDWDVGAVALLGTVAFAWVLWEQQSHARGWQRLVLPGLTAAMLSHVVLWTVVNTSESASAARFESIAGMDEGLLLPMNTFTAYENLRKFHQSGEDTDAYFRVLRRQIATGYRSHIGYSEYLSSILKLKDVRRRRDEFAWLLETYRVAVSRGGAENVQGRIEPRDAREFAARMLLSAWQIGETGLTETQESAFHAIFASRSDASKPDVSVPWPEAGLLAVLRNPGSREEDSLRIATAVTSETRDAFLHMTAGGLYQQRGFPAAAADAYDAALAREPAMYPSWYLVAAEFHRTVRGDLLRSRELLEACIAQAPNTAEARKARELLMP